MNAFLKKQNLKLPLPQSRRGFAVSWQKIVAGVGVLVILIVILNMFSSPIRNSFYMVTAPVSESFWKAGDSVSAVFAPILNSQAQRQENNNLKQENQNLLSQITSLQATVVQDQAVKDAVQNTQGDAFSLAAAQVIGLDTSSDMMLIDKGSDNGIRENMPVISSTKVLYGKVLKVYKNFSQVMLISNKNSVVDAGILLPVSADQPTVGSATSLSSTDAVDSTSPTQSGAAPTPIPVYGAVKGLGNLSVYLDLVPSTAQMSTGQTLVTSAQEGIFPKGLLIGTIISVNKNDAKPFQTASVQPFFNAQTADNLFIITNYKN